MLRGRNWARWGALAWMLFHVILSAFHALHEFAIHAVFLAIMARLLFRPFVPTLRAIFALREAK